MGDVVESKTEQENLGTEAEKAAQEMTPKQATETNLKNGQDKADQEAGKQEKKFRESIKEIFEKSFGPILKIVIEGYANAFNKILEGKNTTIDRATQHELKRIENNYKTKIESAQTTEEKIKLTTEKYQEMIKKMLEQKNISIKILLQTKENENRELKKFNPQTQDFDITKTIEGLQTLKGEKFSEPDVEMGEIAFESKNEDEILKKLQNSDLFKEYVQDGWDKFEFGFTATTEELDFETSKAAFEKQKAYLKALNRECGNGQKVQKMDIQQKLQNLDFDIKFCDQFNGETDISEEDFEAAKTAILKGIDDKKIQKQFEHRCKKLRKIFCKTEDNNQANDDNGSEEGTNNNDNQPTTTPTQPEAATEGGNQRDKDTQPENNTPEKSSESEKRDITKVLSQEQIDIIKSSVNEEDLTLLSNIFEKPSNSLIHAINTFSTTYQNARKYFNNITNSGDSIIKKRDTIFSFKNEISSSRYILIAKIKDAMYGTDISGISKSIDDAFQGNNKLSNNILQLGQDIQQFQYNQQLTEQEKQRIDITKQYNHLINKSTNILQQKPTDITNLLNNLKTLPIDVQNQYTSEKLKNKILNKDISLTIRKGITKINRTEEELQQYNTICNTLGINSRIIKKEKKGKIVREIEGREKEERDI